MDDLRYIRERLDSLHEGIQHVEQGLADLRKAFVDEQRQNAVEHERIRAKLDGAGMMNAKLIGIITTVTSGLVATLTYFLQH